MNVSEEDGLLSLKIKSPHGEVSSLKKKNYKCLIFENNRNVLRVDLIKILKINVILW